MGLLDYYRQFDDMSESEINVELRERRAREKALALEQVPLLDLSGVEWPELPNADVVGSAVFQARGRLNGYPDQNAIAIRRALAEHHYIKADQIVIGNGAAELIQTAAYLLLSEGDEVLVPWPSYKLYPSLAAKAGGHTVSVDLADGFVNPEAIAASVTARTRIVTICNPNDPTGTYLSAERLGELLSALPERVYVLLDEAFIQFQGVEDEDACMKLVDAFPKLLVFRTMSKAYGLSGVRAGYVVGSPSESDLLRSLAPALGVNALTQAAMLQALKVGGDDVERRCATVIEQRQRLHQELERLGVTAPASQASFIWMSAPELDGEQFAAKLELFRIRVAPGGPLGDGTHVRAAIRSQAATDRLLWSVEQALRH